MGGRGLIYQDYPYRRVKYNKEARKSPSLKRKGGSVYFKS